MEQLHLFLSVAPNIYLETAFRHFRHFKPTVNKENTRTNVLADDGFKRQTLRHLRHLMMMQTNRDTSWPSAGGEEVEP